jgi:hypothetical protein
MPNYITLADHEARRLAETGKLLVVRPVVPQPPECTVDFIWNEDPDAEYPHLWLSAYETAEYPSVLNFDPWFRSPLGAPGDVLVCKEAWLHTGLGYKYRVSDPQWGKTCHWRSSTTMPAWAARFRPVVREAGVMRAGDIPGKDAEAMGLDVAAKLPAFPPIGVDIDALVDMVGKQVLAAYWNRRFRKYPWEDNPWVWTAVVETPEKAARDEWAQREADKRRAMLEDMWWEEQNA